MESFGFASLWSGCSKVLKGAFKRYGALYKGPWYRSLVVGFVTFVVALILFLVAVDVNFLWLFGRSPGISDIKHPVTSEASEVYSADGQFMGKFFSENRSPVSYAELPPHLIRTLIDTEDERFYHHIGIDFEGLFSAVADMAKGNARGASTITQQLAKNLFRVRTQYSTGLMGKIPGVKILVLKAKEWIVALKLEAVYSKEDILTMYFNTVDFGSNAFGIKAAAKLYFGTTPARLNYEQCATLVGLLKATSSYNPRLNPQNSLRRRNLVLYNLYSHGDMLVAGRNATKAQYDSIKAMPLGDVSKNSQESNYDGMAPYFREALRDHIRTLAQDGEIEGVDEEHPLDLYADGLKIYTTLDSRMQTYAEEAVRKQMEVIQKRFNEHWGHTHPWQDERHQEIPHFIEDLAKRTTAYRYLTKRFPEHPDSVDHYLNLPHKVKVFSYEGPVEMELSTMDSIRYMVSFMHTGFVAMEPETGNVKAWVGDIDFSSWKYDKVTAKRQPGSTFKLFVYTEAMKQGLTPCDRRMDAYFAMKTYDSNGKETLWQPHNANGYFTGDSMYLKSAFAQSVNSVAVRLGQEVGISNIIRTAHDMGIQSPLDNTPSLSLGSSDVSLLELINSYCTIINEGKAHKPLLVSRIEDRDGNVIYQAETRDKQVMNYRSAFLVRELLRGGLTEPGGTTAALWEYIHDVCNSTDFGGKTGTSNAHSDAWFVGVTPKLVAGAWVGGEYRCIHFRTGQLGQGSRTALPIFGYFMKSVLQDPALAHYQGKFGPAKEDINPSCYSCRGTWHREEADSLDADSLGADVDVENGESEPLNLEIPQTQE